MKNNNSPTVFRSSLYSSNLTSLLVRLAVLIALSVVGALIKIPSPTGTVALDSTPGYLTALAYGPGPGALVAALGHLLSAATAGFPLTLPLHLFVALQMAIIAALVAYANHRFNPVIASVLGIILNGIGAPAAFLLLPQFGTPFFVAMTGPLLVASTINIIAALLLYKALGKTGVL